MKLRVLAIILAVILVDQFVKEVVLEKQLVNEDFALGVPAPTPLLSAVIMVTAAVYLLVSWSPLSSLGVGLLVGGSVSNAADRLAVGGAHDGIPLGPIYFNVADVAIIAGALLLWSRHHRGEWAHEGAIHRAGRVLTEVRHQGEEVEANEEATSEGGAGTDPGGARGHRGSPAVHAEAVDHASRTGGLTDHRSDSSSLADDR